MTCFPALLRTFTFTCDGQPAEMSQFATGHDGLIIDLQQTPARSAQMTQTIAAAGLIDEWDGRAHWQGTVERDRPLDARCGASAAVDRVDRAAALAAAQALAAIVAAGPLTGQFAAQVICTGDLHVPAMLSAAGSVAEVGDVELWAHGVALGDAWAALRELAPGSRPA